jgi:hypothetical protein
VKQTLVPLFEKVFKKINYLVDFKIGGSGGSIPPKIDLVYTI